MVELYTDKVHQLLYNSVEKAKNYGHYQVDVCHLLKAFLEDGSSMFCNILNKSGISISRVSDKVDEYLNSIRRETNSADPNASSDLSNLIMNAKKISEKMKDKYISSDHMVLSLFDNNNTLVKEIIKSFNL